MEENLGCKKNHFLAFSGLIIRNLCSNEYSNPRGNQQQIFVAIHVCANVKNFKNKKIIRIEKSEKKIHIKEIGF
jgi:hypothetical protein